ncbi:MAG: GNAT family N-acetyltransferase [Chitinophagaceae bacterium]|nr:GNAT family N-acetyltransferase [Chitinophagaceae bacterium]
MAREITIRMATAQDAELIADISRQTFYEAFAAQNTAENMEQFMNTQFEKGRLMAELGDPENIFLLAYQDDELAGYVKLRDSENPQHLENAAAIEIVRIYTTASMIGKGIGKVLMQACIDIAKKRDKAIVWLGVWERNQRAIGFYTKWGFEKFSEHDFILGNDIQTDWLMKKHI